MSITKSEQIAREAVRIAAERRIDDKVEIAKLAVEMALAPQPAPFTLATAVTSKSYCSPYSGNQVLGLCMLFTLTSMALIFDAGSALLAHRLFEAGFWLSMGAAAFHAFASLALRIGGKEVK